MTGHLRDDALMDALEGAADADSRRHLEGCTMCSARLQEAREGWELAGRADVPEPSPLYWDAFRHQVGRRIAEAERPRRWFATWWPALAAATAGAVAAVTFLSPAGPASPRLSPAPVARVPSWTVPVEVASAERWGAEDEPMAGDCGDISECLLGMSDEEAEALAELLGEELGVKP